MAIIPNTPSSGNSSSARNVPDRDGPIGTAPAPHLNAEKPKTEAGIKLLELLRAAHESDASDVHLVTGHVPMMRVHQVMVPMELSLIHI